MTIYDWIILGIVVIIFSAVLTTLYPGVWREWWRNDWYKVKPYWNDGWILPCLRVLFWVFSKFAIDRIFVFCIRRRMGGEHRCIYLFIDCHDLIWLIFLSLLLFLLSDYAYKGILLFLIAYRLFQISQSWISQFVLNPWEVRNVYRSLVLCLISYWHIVLAFSLLSFVLRDSNFKGITCWQQAFDYSLRNAITIGSNAQPTSCIGYTIFVFQVLFVILFLTTVVNHIVNYKK